ncbi:hypothetical protein Tco_1093358 [Tanacetum coccineum]|uniref:Uncharacterized protein n=1 Tax=Tanacetum coccineum TaxID=301880 RepID=A0ABQ5ICV7_9ASTR
MDTTRAQEKALDDELVTPENRPKIGKRSLGVSQVENQNSKKNNDSIYPPRSSPKSLTDYFMRQRIRQYQREQDVLVRLALFPEDDFMFTTIRVIFKHKDTQVYAAIIPQHLTNQAMLESEAYMTYRVYATGEMTPKPKSKKKKYDSESSPKTKPTQDSKGKRIKTLAKGDKPAKMKQSATKSKGLTVLSEVALSEADQLKLASKRSKKEFHSSHASGSGAGDKLEVPDVPENRSESEKESWTFNDEDDDQENVSGETKLDDDGYDFVHLNLSTYNADDQEEEKANDDDEVSYDKKVSTPPDYEIKDEEENQEDDNNVMGGEQEDEDLVQQQSSSISSDLMSKFINPSLDTSIDSILNLNVQSDILVNVLVSATTETPSSDTTIPQPPIPIIQPQQQTHDSTTTTTFLEIPNFASLFGFERRVSSLEIELSELKQTNQFTEDLSSIPGIVDNYLAIKEQVKDQLPQILPKEVSNFAPPVIEKLIIESRDEVTLEKVSSQPHSTYEVAFTLTEFELKKILINKKEKRPAFRLLKGTRSNYAELEYDFEECYKALSEKLDWENPEGGDYPFDLSKPLPLITRGKRQRLPFEYFINNDIKYLQGGVSTMTYTMSTTKTKAAQYDLPGIEDMVPNIWNRQSKGDVNSTKRILVVTHVKVMRKDEYGYLEEIVARRADNVLYRFKEGDDVADFAIALRMFTRSLRNRLMRSDGLYKFSDGTLTRLLSSLKDITKNIDMEYLPKRRWSTLEKKRAHFMINDINKLLKERRMMRSLEKFVGGRLYGTDLRLLQRII